MSRPRATDAKSTLILAVAAAAAAARYDDDDDDDKTYSEEFMRVSRQLVRFIFAKSYGRRPARSRKCDATSQWTRPSRRLATSTITAANLNLQFISRCSCYVEYMAVTHKATTYAGQWTRFCAPDYTNSLQFTSVCR